MNGLNKKMPVFFIKKGRNFFVKKKQNMTRQTFLFWDFAYCDDPPFHMMTGV